MKSKPAFKSEFIALMASLMSIVALSIDAMLPALPEIGNSLNVVNPSDNQLLITMIFLGLGFGQLIFGPISDSLVENHLFTLDLQFLWWRALYA